VKRFERAQLIVHAARARGRVADDVRPPPGRWSCEPWSPLRPLHDPIRHARRHARCRYKKNTHLTRDTAHKQRSATHILDNEYMHAVGARGALLVATKPSRSQVKTRRTQFAAREACMCTYSDSGMYCAMVCVRCATTMCHYATHRGPLQRIGVLSTRKTRSVHKTHDQSATHPNRYCTQTHANEHGVAPVPKSTQNVLITTTNSGFYCTDGRRNRINDFSRWHKGQQCKHPSRTTKRRAMCPQRHTQHYTTHPARSHSQFQSKECVPRGERNKNVAMKKTANPATSRV
jgi:hypothetical protein